MAHETTDFGVRAQATRVALSARALARATSRAKDSALLAMADALLAHAPSILAANAQDVERAHAKELAPAFIDRLILDDARLHKMAAALQEIASLPDPVGQISELARRPNGIQVGRQRIPLGVLGIIYESRPNVTSDAAALCLKSGNGVVLKGGSDAFSSNQAIHQALRAGLASSELPPAAHDAIGFVDTRDRGATVEMLGLADLIDVVIPRGGKSLIKFVHQNSRIPVIKHDEGVCHIVVEGTAPADQVVPILLNAKVQRPGVCNSVETILFTQNAVDTHLRPALEALHASGVTLHLDPTAMAAAQGLTGHIHPVDEDAYAREFLALEVAIGVLPDVDAAIAHIDRYGSRHTESLLTGSYALGQQFLREVDSSVVMLNASTRFSDGGELGLGAEIGISTTRMHAYGPMGLQELTTTKFIVMGEGQIR